MGMAEEAMGERREYMREYRSRNRDRINTNRREWNAKNPEKRREHTQRYWAKRAWKRNIRASWEDYGITDERRRELKEIAKSDEYAGMVLSAALAADRVAAGHIILSVTEKLNYEMLEFHGELGRCPLGRTDFYGARRLFFHYLDMALKNSQETLCGGKEERCEECNGTRAELSGKETV